MLNFSEGLPVCKALKGNLYLEGEQECDAVSAEPTAGTLPGR